MKIAMAILGVLVISGVIGLLVGSYAHGQAKSERGPIEPTALALDSPEFATSEGASFLEDEAGISLYFNAAQALSLSTARGVYRTVEIETTDYIVGSIALPSLPEADDVHCYVHKDGWIVTYYLAAEPVSKIIDWNYYSSSKLTTNKLRVGMNLMCSSLALSPANLGYYHWQFPQANRFMIITESNGGSGTDSFNLNIPSTFAVYERSWSHRGGSGNPTRCGLLTLDQLMPDAVHVVAAGNPGTYHTSLLIDEMQIDEYYTGSISASNASYIAIVLVYREM